MDDFLGYAVLMPSDIDVIEHIYERKISQELRCYLLDEFGAKGRRETYARWADEALKECIGEYGGCTGCGGCAISHPYLGVSLLSLVQEALADAERGLIDFETGERIEPKPIDLPF
jgi:ferredoxin